MKTLSEHIAHVKTKPHHIRKQVAIGASFAISALVAVFWFATALTEGTFTIHSATFAESTGADVATSNVPGQNNSLLAGVAASQKEQTTGAHIEIVSTATSSTMKNKGPKAEQTVIPF